MDDATDGAPVAQAIDLIDEAGSRARIEAFMARKPTGGNAALQRQPWEELAQVMEAKAEAIKVPPPSGTHEGL